MAEVKTANKTKVVFIGKVWNNQTKGGKQYPKLSIDRGVELTLKSGDFIELWPNNKREGKQDADFRASVRVAAEQA